MKKFEAGQEVIEKSRGAAYFVVSAEDKHIVLVAENGMPQIGLIDPALFKKHKPRKINHSEEILDYNLKKLASMVDELFSEHIFDSEFEEDADAITAFVDPILADIDRSKKS
jgi:hypothetical protein